MIYFPVAPRELYIACALQEAIETQMRCLRGTADLLLNRHGVMMIRAPEYPFAALEVLRDTVKTMPGWN